MPADEAAVPRVRSMLFVPGTRPELVAKAVAAGADAVILDLEDAVAEPEKAVARGAVAEFLGDRPPVSVFVRINAVTEPHALADLQAVVGPGLAGVMVPKVSRAREMFLVGRLLDWLEAGAGVPPGRTLILPVLETAEGMRRAYRICRSPRVAFAGGIATRGGDIERALGYRHTAEGRESFGMRSAVLLDARAAGVPNPVTGMWADIRDIEGLRRFAEQGRDLGYEGMVAIHPSHVPVLNEVFGTPADERAEDEALLAAFDAAGGGVAVHRGHMIDRAMAETARARLRRSNSDDGDA